jgi:hypothetical protein
LVFPIGDLVQEASERLAAGEHPDAVRRWLLECAVDGLVTVEEVARQYGIAPRTVRQLAASRRLGVRLGEGVRTVWLFTPADVEALRERKVGRPRKAAP